MQEEAIVAINPGLPWKDTDILGFDGQNFTAILIIKCKNPSMFTFQLFPDHSMGIIDLVFTLTQALQFIRISQLWLYLLIAHVFF